MALNDTHPHLCLNFLRIGDKKSLSFDSIVARKMPLKLDPSQVEEAYV
jgi:hypothetical protein